MRLADAIDGFVLRRRLATARRELIGWAEAEEAAAEVQERLGNAGVGPAQRRRGKADGLRTAEDLLREIAVAPRFFPRLRRRQEHWGPEPANAIDEAER